ncbi:MAG: GAF domain-containing protein [Bradyrhizobium sp.]|nr:GAF domain-containing protein [Bradyrhizobium sp.]
MIAIQNTQLFNETQEALARQTATSDVLQVISSSVADTTPVFDKILDSCEKLFATEQLGIFLVHPDGQVHPAAWRGAAFEAVIATLPRPVDQSATGIVIRNRGVLHFPNIALAKDLPRTVQDLRDNIGDVSMAWAPMLGDEQGVGSIAVMRQPPDPFSDKELALLKTFADQAVIAIQNTRLFNETREALERQTATADILKVIASSPDNVQPVFEAVAASANRLIGGLSTAVFRFIGSEVHLASFTPISPDADAVLRSSFPGPIAAFGPFEAAARGELVQIVDSEAGEEGPARQVARARGYRSALLAPLLHAGRAIGLIGVTRATPGTFSPHHVQLLQSFADQAVIAIQNTRLFNETQEALQSQTATADILKVIARSPSDVQPVFDQILNSIKRLIESDERVIVLAGDDGLLRMGAAQSPRGEEVHKLFPRPLQGSAAEMVIRERKLLAFADVITDPAAPPSLKAIAPRSGARSFMMAPLLSENRAIGAITTTRRTVDPFDEKERALLSTFADQAVIAIENVRLFNETKEALEQQTATSEVLEIISSSPGDLDPVFQKMLDNACRVCEANFGTMNLWNGEEFNNVARHNMPPAFAAVRQQTPIRPHPDSPMARIVRTHQLVHEHDFKTSPSYLAGAPTAVALVDIAGARTLLVVPMLKEDELIGTITIYRQEVRPFTDKQIALVENFTKQAVIAIENTRLLRELRERTDDLTRSLDDLRAAQDRLVQTEKLASLGQLTAGIAHEIKNPLNFVNNFSLLSAELTDELNDTLKDAALTDRLRDEVGELTKLLKENLEKVVQHGKRADSIVKNMLLHSRAGAGEQRSADVNALVEESLNLAYHGARAEKPGFNITLQRDFDAGAGSAELFPQEITRALLNLISNGFYAATRRNAEAGFEPILLATTKNLGSSVEIRIRDNGTGIPPEVKEKMFNPFFTTKPAGEGTGLGLSMTHDIVVKQHGGRIDVVTKPGEFTEFTIVLPRTGSPQARKPS